VSISETQCLDFWDSYTQPPHGSQEAQQTILRFSIESHFC
jgi:hypothetical protein